MFQLFLEHDSYLSSSFNELVIRTLFKLLNTPRISKSFTFYAKVLVADKSTAYLGSANFTQYGFERNIELGVLLKGKQVKPLYSLLNVILSSRGVLHFFMKIVRRPK
ncbi:hypothetical protein D3C75_824020 [compost metagenome]